MQRQTVLEAVLRRMANSPMMGQPSAHCHGKTVQRGYPPAYLSSLPSTVSLAIDEGPQKQERGHREGNDGGGMEDVGGTFITPLRTGKSSWEEI